MCWPKCLLYDILSCLRVKVTRMSTAQDVETSVTANNNSPIQDCVQPDDQTQPTHEMTHGFKPFTSGRSREGVRGALPSLFLDQADARKAKKNVFWRPGPPLSQGLDDRPSALILRSGSATVHSTVKPLLSGHLQDLPKCPLNRGCKNCAIFVNDQHSTVTLYCDKVACC